MAEIEGGEAKNAAVVARRVQMTAARVSQILRLLNLAPGVLRCLEDPEATGPVPNERQLHELLRATPTGEQLAAFDRLCTEARHATKPGRPKRVVPKASRERPGRRAGHTLPALLERARRYERLLRSGKYRSLSEIARAEGIDRTAVSVVHQLLYLPIDIIEAVESAEEPLPGVTVEALRRIAGMRDAEAQRAAFQTLIEKARKEGDSPDGI